MEYERGDVQLVVLGIFDAKVKAWLIPMFYRTVGEGIRAFSDAVNDEQTGFNKHPEDYSLHVLGKFGQESGVFVNEEPGPTVVVSALQVLRPEETGVEKAARIMSGGR